MCNYWPTSKGYSELIEMAHDKKPSVLLVDDDSMLRAMLRLILLGENYRVVGEASNGRDAIAQFANLKPELVLLDINMPEMDGLQALEAMRQANPEALVMMVSAEATMDKVNQALALGAVGFVVKPFNPASVLDRVESCLRGKGWTWQKN
jgi:two-component system chemotaxis response regulator CheY